MKIVRRVILIVVFLAVVVGGFVYKYISTMTHFNEPDTNGNTIGNLYGNGLFCEIDDTVYFANPNDGDRLYKMNPDESDIQYVANDSIFYLNADEHYLYYSRNGKKYKDNSQMGFLGVNTDSLCRMDRKSKKVTILDDAICNACALCGNTVIYLRYDAEEATTLYTVKIDATEREQLSKVPLDPRCVVGDKFYYAGVENDHNLHSMNITTKDSSYVSAENLWLPIIMKRDLYFIDLDNKHRVYTVSLGGGTKTGLTSYGAVCYNLNKNYLYYQSLKGNPDGLYMVDLTTGAEFLIAEGQYNNINITSKYVYFQDYYSEATFHVPVGSTSVSLFNPPIKEVDTK